MYLFKKMNWNVRIVLFSLKYSHDNGAFLTPDALGGVFCLHIGGHAILHDARDVLLDHVCTVIPAGTEEIKVTFIATTLVCSTYWNLNCCSFTFRFWLYNLCGISIAASDWVSAKVSNSNRRLDINIAPVMKEKQEILSFTNMKLHYEHPNKSCVDWLLQQS